MRETTSSFIVEAGADHDGQMVALTLPPAVVELLLTEVAAVNPGQPTEDPGNIHCTLVYFGDTYVDPDMLHEAVADFASKVKPFTGRISGYGQFLAGDEVVLYAGLDAVGLERVRIQLIDTLEAHEIYFDDSHGFTPHITLSYSEQNQTVPDVMPTSEIPFSEVVVADGGDWTPFPLQGESSRVVRAARMKRLADDDDDGWYDKEEDEPTNTAPDTYALNFVKGEPTPERKALHDKLIQKALAKAQPRTDGGRPQAVFMGGGPASGKSSVLKGRQSVGLTIDPDDFKKDLPEYQEKLKRGDLTAASHVHEESSYLAKRLKKELEARGLDYTLDGCGDGSVDKMAAKIADAKQAGYHTHGIYVSCPTREAWRRSRVRAKKTGRQVPKKFLRQAHAEVSKTFKGLMDRGALDSAELWDTTNDPPTLVGGKKDGEPWKVRHDKLWQDFLEKGNEMPDEQQKAAFAKPKPNRLEVMRKLINSIEHGMGPHEVDDPFGDYHDLKADIDEAHAQGHMIHLPEE
jgi:2'-5' RNA ligase/predicted ABC-type ATPase